LGKYLGKGMFEADGRRFNTSRNWPSEKRRRLLSGEDKFKRAIWTPGGAPEDIALKWDEIPRSGTDRQKREGIKTAARRLMKIGEQIVDLTES